MDILEQVAVDALVHRRALIRLLPDLLLTRLGSIIALKRLQQMLAEPEIVFESAAIQQELDILIASADQIIRNDVREVEYLGEAGCIEVSVVLTDRTQLWMQARKHAELLDRSITQFSALRLARHVLTRNMEEEGG